jgi:transcriptional regulator with XRE-family HTH domain
MREELGDVKTSSMTAKSGAPPQDSSTPEPGRRRPLVGRQIRRLRLERQLTLAVIAERSGLNLGYLSQVENDKASPSLETLQAIADAIGCPVAWFLIDSAPPPRVVRAWERPHRVTALGGRLEEVDGRLPRDLRIFEASIDPGARTGLHAHGGEEHHLVLSGRLRATQGDHVTELGPGDYLLWDATIPHDVEVIGDEPVRVILVSHTVHGG